MKQKAIKITCTDPECTGATIDIGPILIQAAPNGPYLCPYCRGLKFYIGPAKA